jgi:broad specificity phosphatase PhoE
MQSLFFLGRHGETFLNEQNKYRGWSNGPNARLNDLGHQQAEELAKFFLSLKQPFSHIISSPLNRAQVTAAIIAQKLGIEDIIIDERLLPLNVGNFAGTSKTENKITPYIENPDLRFPGGETIREFEKREKEFFDELLPYMEQNRVGDKEFLVIAHVSNIMYWWNRTNTRSDEEYLSERTDITEPGGAVLATNKTAVPIFKANMERYAV